MKALVLSTVAALALAAPAYANCKNGSCNHITTITSHSNDGNSYSKTISTVTVTKDSNNVNNVMPELKSIKVRGIDDTVEVVVTN